MVLLGVNIDHIASIRQLRRGSEPSLEVAAKVAESAGADSIVVHLREDRRHVHDADVFSLRKSVRTRLNLEMSLADEIVRIACIVKPDQATIVPERRKELTTEGGLDVIGNTVKLKRSLKRLRGRGIPVSLFIDPQKKQIVRAAALGIQRVELHTGRYAQARSVSARKAALRELLTGAQLCAKNGMRVFAGHGLDYSNVTEVARISLIEELNIGYAIVCRAALVGLARAVREMKQLITTKEARTR